MPPIHDDAICLRHREWSETSQTVTLLTRTHGLLHGLAKGAFRDKAPFSGGFEHLQLGEIGFINRPDREFAILTDWDLTDPFPALRSDYKATTIAMLAGELTASLLAPCDPHPTVFAGLAQLLGGIGRDDPVRSLAECLLGLLEDTGHAVALPTTGDTTALESIWAFDPDAGVFAPDPNRRRPVADPFGPAPRAGVWHVRGETLAVLEAAQSGSASSDIQGGVKNDAAAWTRVANFLTACAVYRSARRPASLDAFRRVLRIP